MKTEVLLKVLQISCKKHGELKPLTLGHLKNLVGLVKKYEDAREDQEIEEHKELVNLFCDPNF